MAHRSFTRSVLEKTLEIASQCSGEAPVAAVSSAMLAQTRLERKRVLNALCDLYRHGRLVRIRQGVYGPPPPKGPVTEKRQIMWNFFKMRRRVTVEDLQVAAEASKDYAKEWLGMLVRQNVARKEQRPGMSGVWILVNDCPEMPIDSKKAEKLKEIRKRRIQQLGLAIDEMTESMGKLRIVIRKTEKETDDE